MANGTFSLYCLDTTPGANSPFAPPLGWDRDAQSYLKLMWWRYKNDVQARQQLHCLARRMSSSNAKNQVTYAGPFSLQAQQVINYVIGERKKNAAEEAAEEARKAS